MDCDMEDFPSAILPYSKLSLTTFKWLLFDVLYDNMGCKVLFLFLAVRMSPC